MYENKNMYNKACFDNARRARQLTNCKSNQVEAKPEAQNKIQTHECRIGKDGTTKQLHIFILLQLRQNMIET